MRRALVTMAVGGIALVGLAAPASAAPIAEVPRPVGFMPAAEPPPDPESSPVAPALEVVGGVLLVAGIAVAARSWVSPARAG